MYCPSCGTQNPDDGRFCRACGAPLPQPAGTPAPQPAPGAHAATPAPQPVPTPTAGTPTPHRAPKLPIAIGAGVVVLAAAGFIAWSLFLAPYSIDAKTFGDTAVASAVSTQLDVDHDGKLSREEAKGTELSVDGATTITKLGKVLPRLTKLTLKGASLSTIDVSDLPDLTELDIPDAKPATIDVSHNTKLDKLNVAGDTKITGLDQTKLTEVWLPTQVKMDYGQGNATLYNTVYNANGSVAKLDVVNGSSGISMAHKDYSYDDAGKLTKVSWAYDYRDDRYGSMETALSYDDAGRLVKTTADNSTTAYSYDDAGRLVKIEYGNAGSTEPTTFTYDAQGRCASMTEYGATTTYTYDDAGRCTAAITVKDGKTLSSVTYGYDDAGHLTSVADPVAKLTSFSYSYQGDKLVEAKGTNESGEVTEDFKLSYDDAGRLVKAEDTNRGNTYSMTYTRAFAAKDGEKPTGGFTLKPAYVVISGAWTASPIDVVDPLPERPTAEPYSDSGVIDRLDMWY